IRVEVAIAKRMRVLRGPFLATGVAQGVLIPFMAPLLASRGDSPQTIGLVYAVASAAVVIAAPIWGQVGDVLLGPRPTMQCVVLMAAIAALLLGASVAPPLVAARSRPSICCKRRFPRFSTQSPCTLLDPSAVGTASCGSS
ncbi:MAG TPA: MFS transporter, partial [Roseiarcus sp.]|nr:MFS transporter [Roseiarcus sp.]